MTRPRHTIVLCAVLLAAVATLHVAWARAADGAPAAWTQRLMEAMGGQRAWDTLRTVRWSFAVTRNDTLLTARTHYWDKATMRDRVEYTRKDGTRVVTIVDLSRRTADTWANGARVTGDDSTKAAERGYGLWVNDSYWCFAPYKTGDQGVTRTDAGDTLEVGVRYHRMRLTFDHVGLTPGDTYWLYLNATSGMMEKWAYVLQGESPPPETWWWQDWKKVGPIWLAATRRNPASPVRIEMRDLAYYAQPPDAMFTSPGWVETPGR